MKKKIITIVASSLGAIVVSALLAMGILMLVQKRNVAETGNVLGVAWYNEEDKEFEITTAEQLNDLARLSKFYDFKGQTVKLSADIVMNEGNAEDWATNAPKTRWMPIQQFNGTFDGQGHSISGLYGKGYESPMALFAKTGSSAVVQNISLVNSYFQTGGSLGTASFAVEGEGRFIKLYSDAKIVNKGEYSAGIIAKVSMSAVLEECWFDGSISQQGRYMGGIVAVANSGRTNISHCLFSGTLTTTQKLITYAGTDGIRTGGICGSVNENATLIMADSLVSGTFGLEHTTYSGSVIGAIFNGGSANATDVYTTEQITGRDTIGSGSGRAESLPVYMKKSDMVGIKAYQWTTLDFDNYWAVVEEGTPILKTFAEEVPSLVGIEKEFDISWYNKNSYEATITNLKELYGLALLSKSVNFQDVVIRLGADIVVNEGNAKNWQKSPNKAPKNPWNPIGTSTVRFSGTFDGQGHSISGIYYNANGEAEQRIGVFGTVGVGGIIKNLKVTNSYYNLAGNLEQRYAGGVVAWCQGTLDTLYSDVIIEADGQDIGGIAGYLNYSGDLGFSNPLVNNCWFNGKLIGSTCRRVGGIVGAVFGVADAMPTYTFTNCLNTGYISNKRVPNSGDGLGGQYIGGILGQEANPCNVILRNCLMAGTIDTEYATYVGSVMGRLVNDTSTLTLDNMYTTSESFKRVIHESKGIQKGSVIVLPKTMLTGVNGYKWTTLDFGKYWVATKNDTPVLKSFVDTAKVQTTSTAKVKRMVDVAWYKSSAKEMTIDTLEELYGLWLLSNGEDFEGQTIKLDADIAVNVVDVAMLEAWKSGNSTAVNPWFPIGSNEVRFTGTFDGQMHTISGIYLNTELRNQFLGVFGCTGNGSTIKNLKVTNSVYVVNGDTGVRNVGGIVGYNRGNLDTLYSDVDIITDGQDIGGISGYLNFYEATAEQRIHNLWFNGSISGDSGRRMGGITGVVYGKEDKVPTYRFDNCLNTATISNTRKNSKDGFGGQLIGGILGKEANQTNVILKDCMNAGTIDLTYKTYAGNLIGRPETKASIYTMDNVYMVTDAFPEEYNDAKATVNGHIFKFSKKELTGVGGYRWTLLDFDKYWTAIENDTPVLKSFVDIAKVQTTSIANVKRMVDVAWYKSSAKEMTIDTLEELYGLCLLSNTEDFEGQTIKLGADIAVNEVDAAMLEAWKSGNSTAVNPWFPIGNNEVRFTGTFDGQMHTISGIYLNTELRNQFLGVFGCTGNGSTIKNLKVTNSVYVVNGDTGVRNVGGIVGYNRGNLDTLYSGVDIITDGQDIGGIAGYLNFYEATAEQRIHNLWFNGSISGDSGRRMGGITGVVYGKEDKVPTYRFDNCLNTATISNTRKNTKDGFDGQLIGGILGKEANQTNVILKDCMNAGTIDLTFKTYAGNLIGRPENNASVYQIDNVYMVIDAFSEEYNGANATVNGHIFKFTEQTLTGAGGYKWTSLDFNKYWVAVENDTPVLKSFAECAGGNIVDVSTVAKVIDTKWYDDNPDAQTFKIGTKEDLYGLWSLVARGNSFKGKEIELVADVAVNAVDVFADGTTSVDKWKDGTAVAANPWFPIGSSGAPFAGTFDGNNHTISGICVNDSAAGGSQGIFAYLGKDGVIKNLKATDSLYQVKGDNELRYIGGIVAYAQGSLINLYSDVDIVTDGYDLGGIAGYLDYTGETDGRKVKNCWFNGSISGEKARRSGGIIGSVLGHSTKDAVYSISNCLFTGYVGNERVPKSGDGCGGQYIGGILGRDTNTAEIHISDSLVAGTVYSKYTTFMASVVGHIGSKDTTLTADSIYVAKESYSGDFVHPESLGVIQGDFTKVTRDSLYGYGALMTIELDFESAWSAVVGSMPIPTALLESTHQVVTLNTDWYDDAVADGEGNEPGHKKNPYKIGNAGDLYGLAKLINQAGVDFTDKTIVLTGDIIINSSDVASTTGLSEWTPIVTFTGIFDGQRHKISGVTIAAGAGMFTKVTGKVGNFTLCDTNVTANTHGSGSVVGTLTGELYDVFADSSVKITATNRQHIGGLVGKTNNTTGTAKITNCSFAGTMSNSNAAGGDGGILGTADTGTCEMVNCEMSGTVTSATYVGGLVGWQRNSGSLTIRNCLVTGSVTTSGAKINAGTIIGAQNTSAAAIYLEDVYTAGTNHSNTGDTETTGIKGLGNQGEGFIAYGLTESVTKTDITGSVAHSNLNLDFYSNDNEDGAWVATNGLPKLKIAVTSDDTVITDYTATPTQQYGWYYLETKKTIGVKETTGVTTGGTTVDVTPATGTTFKLETAGDLLGWNNVIRGTDVVQDNFSGDTVKLMNSVNLNPSWDASQKTTPSVEWLSIGSSGSFVGTFDGGNHTISGLYVSSTGFGRGMFAALTGTTIIKDFTLSNSYVSGKNNVGAIAGTMQKNSELQNVRVDNTVFVKGNLSVGGLVGAASGANTVGQVKMTGCSFAGTIDATDIYPSSEDNTQGRCGGLIGEVRNGHNVIIDRCGFTGSAQGVNPLGGIVGYVRESSSVTITNSIASGTLQLTYANGSTTVSGQVGQIVGLLEGSATVTLTKVDSDDCVCYKADGTTQASRVRTSGTFTLNDNDK